MARILAVDDDSHILRSVDRILRRVGHEVVPTASGSDALEIARDEPFDVALVDFELPNLDGLEVMSRLRELQPGCLRILVTGHLDLPTVVEAVNRGEVMRVVEKPFKSQRLLEAVNEVLATKQRMAEVYRVQEEAGRAQERAMLLECLESDQIQLALQPMVRARDGSLRAFEALLRTQHPVLDGPLPVLRAAERHGMLPQLAKVVVDRAATWMKRLPPSVMLFLNLHPEELGDPEGMTERLMPLVPWSSRIVLEITERSQLPNIEAWEDSVERVTTMGFSIAVDDLGAGYSSLSALAELKPRYIKVDMSIVRGIDADPRKQRLVELLVKFAEATDAELIAEGVETAEEGNKLRALGAHMLQGYLFGRPSRTPEIPRLAAV